MLAICSDIDQTTLERFVLLHRFLNTREETSLGRGLGLDVADSFWFYAPHGNAPAATQMSFFAGMDWRERSGSADQILRFIRGGWIDTLHSFGNFNEHPVGQPGSFTREHAERALAALEEAGVGVKIWSNHGNRNNIQNILREQHWVGDQPGHHSRHSDLLRRFGIRFVWSSFMSADFRRDVPVELSKLRDDQFVWRFSRQDYAFFRDVKGAEQLAARFGVPIRESDGGVLAVVWHPRALHVQLSSENLNELIEKGGYAVVGQHLGVGVRGKALPPEAIRALHRLKHAEEAGDILVARTSRLLEYAVAREHLRFETAQDAAGKIVINILRIDDPLRNVNIPDLDRLRGITFEMDASENTPVELRLRGAEIPRNKIVEHHCPHYRGIGIRWFAADYADYAP